MSLPLPKPVTALIGRQVLYQATPDDEPSPATVVDARWTGTEIRGRAGLQLCLDTGDGPLVWSREYPAPTK